MKDVQDALMLGRASDGSLVRRPLSPHAGIYRWPITMVASILNRMTAVALSAGSLLLVWWLVAAAEGPAAFAQVQSFIASPVGLLMLLGWTASLFYHLFAGLRHLAWDLGYGFAKPGLNPLSWLVLAASAAATVGVWAVAYAAAGS